MRTSRVDSGRTIDVEYEMHGDRLTGRPLLLVNGLGQQLIAWHPGLLDALVRRGYAAAVFDNRDAGLSTHLDGEVADLLRIAAGKAEPPYRLANMAADAVAVLDAAGLESAHVLGVSMGGMIAQQLAIDHPGRVRTMTSIMSTTGDRSVGRPQPGMVGLLVEAPTGRAEYLDHAVVLTAAIGSPMLPPDLEWVRSQAEVAYERAHDPKATGRQFAAIQGSGNRTPALRDLTVPTLVVHGRADPLVTLSGGEATAAAIPGARLLVLDDMAHDLPEPLWPQLLFALDELTARA